MPFFGRKKETNNNYTDKFVYATEDKQSSSTKSKKEGGIFSRKKNDKRAPQLQEQSMQQQAMMYGLSLKNKRDQDLEEREAIEKKMAKQNGKKYRGKQRSKADDAKTALKIVSFVRKQK